MPRKRIAQAPTETPDALETPLSVQMAQAIPAPLPRSQRGPGAPTLLSAHTATTIINAVRAGNYYDTAAALAGVSRYTMNIWRNKGETDDAPAPYRQFVDALRQAEAEAEADAVRSVIVAGERDWKATASWLGRRHRERWSEQRFGGESGNAGVTINIGVALTSSTSSPQVIEAQLLSVPRLEDE